MSADAEVRAVPQPRGDLVPEGAQEALPVARLSLSRVPAGAGEATRDGSTGVLLTLFYNTYYL